MKKYNKDGYNFFMFQFLYGIAFIGFMFRIFFTKEFQIEDTIIKKIRVARSYYYAMIITFIVILIIMIITLNSNPKFF